MGPDDPKSNFAMPDIASTRFTADAAIPSVVPSNNNDPVAL